MHPSAYVLGMFLAAPGTAPSCISSSGVELPVDLPSLHLVWLYHCLYIPSLDHRIGDVSVYIYIPSLGRVSDIRTVSVSLSVLAAISAVMFVGL